MMEAKTYTTIDRAALGWPAGPWDGEPDKVQWPDETTGLPCLAVRNLHFGHWCGYVGLSPDHPMYGKGYSDEGVDFAVHGGLTFADKCRPGENEAEGICHTPAPGEPDHVWWFGFDCAHIGDRWPRDEMHGLRGGIWSAGPHESYRTLAYVQRQCVDLAAQVASVNSASA
jgi:hypothetical protein